MKTIKEIKDHFSMEEIKLLIEIVRGRQDFDIMETAIKDFYSDEINIFSFDGKEKLHEDVRETLLEKLEFDFEMGGII
jgi:hypothetical protein